MTGEPDDIAELETMADRRRDQVVEMLRALAASMIRNGAPPKQVEQFVDKELDRMEQISAGRPRR